MTLPHLANLGVHIGAGVVGISLGMMQLAREKGDARHRALGTWFMAALLTVTGSALIGTIAFRFMPLFAVLTLLTTYMGVGGWRVARTQARGPGRFDMIWSLLALGAAVALVPILLRGPFEGSSRPVVVWSTLGGVGLLLAYDFVKWTFPRRWFARIWLPEHIYKMASALFGMISAFVGNVVRWGQPWSQVAPSAVGMLIIFYWWWRVASRDYRTRTVSTTRDTTESLSERRKVMMASPE